MKKTYNISYLLEMKQLIRIKNVDNNVLETIEVYTLWVVQYAPFTLSLNNISLESDQISTPSNYVLRDTLCNAKEDPVLRVDSTSEVQGVSDMLQCVDRHGLLMGFTVGAPSAY